MTLEHRFPKKSLFLRPIYSASFFFSFALSLLAYINSSFIGNIIGVERVGLLYTFGAFCTLVLLSLISETMARWGNKIVSLLALSGNIFALLLLSQAHNSVLIILGFIILVVSNSIVAFSFDVFVEHYSNNQTLGYVRGFYLSLINTGWIIGPFIAATLISLHGFHSVYTLALGVMIFAALLVLIGTKHFKDRTYLRLPIWFALSYLRKEKNILRITIVNFLLQFFYVWMVIYAPLYLHMVIGLSWKSLGIIFAIMLTSFVIFEFPVGIWSDRFGEKPFLMSGLIIMALSTIVFSMLTSQSVILWALVLFMSRVGASFVESASETYFFKSITDSHASIIGVFRDVIPLAYLVAPLLATIILSYGSYKALFGLLSFIIISGVPLVIILHDTPHPQTYSNQ